jgi:hypothetical protein
MYSNEPGQWGEVLLSAGSINNYIDWAVIKNGTTGIEADTLGASTSPTLTLSHTIIKSMSQIGLLGQGSYIVGDDDVIADCQYYCVDLSLGGNYSFEQCTFANYWSYGQRQTPTLFVNDWYQDINGNYQQRPLTKAFFGNCIIYGSLTEELQLDSTHNTSMAFPYFFQNCDLLTKQNIKNTYHYNDSIINVPPPFYNTSTDDYEIHSGSQLTGWGNTNVCSNPILSQDLNGKGRNCPPDLGAYNSQ